MSARSSSSPKTSPSASAAISLRDAHVQQLPGDAEPAASFHRDRGARVRAGDAAVVERTALEQPRERLGDVVGRVAAILEPRAHPLDREFAARQQLEPFGMRARPIHRSG